MRRSKARTRRAGQWAALAALAVPILGAAAGAVGGQEEPQDNYTYVPHATEMDLVFEEVAVLGRSSDESPLIQPVDVAWDGEGFLVLDKGERNIKSYSRAGEFLDVLGRRGQGPAEFTDPYQVWLDEGGRAIVFEPDLRLLIGLTRRGTEVWRLHLRATVAGQVQPIEDGYVTVVREPGEDGWPTLRLGILGTNGVVKNVLPALEVRYAWLLLSAEHRVRRWFSYPPFRFEIMFTITPEGKVVAVRPDEYRLMIYRGVNDVEPLAIVVEEEGRAFPDGFYESIERRLPDWVSSRERQRLRDLRLPSVNGIGIAEGEFIITLVSAPWHFEEVRSEIDIFELTGEYLGRGEVPFPLHRVRGELWASIVESDEESFVKIYKLAIPMRLQRQEVRNRR